MDPVSRTLRIAALLVVVSVWISWTAGSASASAPAGQVYVLTGQAVLKPVSGGPERVLGRGDVLWPGDHLRVAAGAEVGIYYRQGGRAVIRGGTQGVSGAVSTFAPASQPYRSQAVHFGATRNPGDAAPGIADSSALLAEDPPVLSASTEFSLGLAADGPEADLFSRIWIRVLDGESEVAAAGLEAPRRGQVLRLSAGAAPAGAELTLEVGALPLSPSGDTFVHRSTFYVALPTRPDTGVSDLLTSFLFSTGALPVRLGAGWAALGLQRELVGDAARPCLATILRPVAAR